MFPLLRIMFNVCFNVCILMFLSSEYMSIGHCVIVVVHEPSCNIFASLLSHVDGPRSVPSCLGFNGRAVCRISTWFSLIHSANALSGKRTVSGERFVSGDGRTPRHIAAIGSPLLCSHVTVLQNRVMSSLRNSCLHTNCVGERHLYILPV